MNEWIADCSLTAALFLPDESSQAADEFFNRFPVGGTLFVPVLWWQETGNVLANVLRQKRITLSRIFEIFELIEALPISTVSNYGKPYVMALFELARIYGISTYDASYLELAMAHGAGIASLDADLNWAAAEAGVRVWKAGG